MPERNAEVPEDRQIVFRIGINLDDVIIDGDDIYGNGVNVGTPDRRPWPSPASIST